MVEYSAVQRRVIDSRLDTKLFLSGIAGTGKTTAGVARLQNLLSSGVRSESILVLTPQRTLQEPYLNLLNSPATPAGGQATTATLGGLTRRLCDLFWPLAAQEAGFAHPERPPIFLTLETAQYYMALVVRPLVAQGYFESVTIDRNRLYTQIIDNLNKSASVGFSYMEIGARLDSAWYGDPSQRRIYTDAQDCATRFRKYCLENNLLDFSLQLEVFWNFLWPNLTVHQYMTKTYRHLIYDNVEEDIPRAHDLIRAWLEEFDSALLIYDETAGYRRFLGADVQTAYALREMCSERQISDQSFVMSVPIVNLTSTLGVAIDPGSRITRIEPKILVEKEGTSENSNGLKVLSARFYPELMDAVVSEIRTLIYEQKRSPSEIVVLAPFLSDTLRFALTSRLKVQGIPWRTHRPSRSLREEPASQTLLTLAALAHPQWNLRPSKFDVVCTWMLALNMDLVRAQLLAEIVYRTREFSLSPFGDIVPDKQERITTAAGDRYSLLRRWLLEYRAGMPIPLDHFFRRLFGEVLSQPGFGFHLNLDGARVASALIESIHKFRITMEPFVVNLDHNDFDLGKEYVAVLQEGVIAAQYLESWQASTEPAVLIAPAYTFLMMNHPVSIQFWLDPGSSGWFERLDQPLTHTQVLSREWQAGRKWTFSDEEQMNLETMGQLVTGLLRRCREKVILGISSLGESGFEQRGRLLHAFQKILQNG